MNGRPLVSVLVPYFNARRSLPLALASLLAQTYREWECILVDDGSSAPIDDLVEAAGDPRIRYIRRATNRGRGATRQQALEQAGGSLICSVDADDWIFPDKLERQVEVLLRQPELALVATGLSIVDAENQLVAVRRLTPAPGVSTRGPFAGLLLPIPTAPAMFRAELLRDTRYDAGLRTTEDLDFFLQYLRGHRYGLLPDSSYVYSEIESNTARKTLQSLATTRQVLRKHAAAYPLQSRVEIARTWAKELAYRTGFALGLRRQLILRRSGAATSDDRDRFLAARATVLAECQRRFGSS